MQRGEFVSQPQHHNARRSQSRTTHARLGTAVHTSKFATNPMWHEQLRTINIKTVPNKATHAATALVSSSHQNLKSQKKHSLNLHNRNPNRTEHTTQNYTSTISPRDTITRKSQHAHHHANRTNTQPQQIASQPEPSTPKRTEQTNTSQPTRADNRTQHENTSQQQTPTYRHQTHKTKDSQPHNDIATRNEPTPVGTRSKAARRQMLARTPLDEIVQVRWAQTAPCPLPTRTNNGGTRAQHGLTRCERSRLRSPWRRAYNARNRAWRADNMITRWL